MRNDQVVTIRRADYRPPDFLLDKVALEFDLDPALTYVTATLELRRNPIVGGSIPLQLDGEDLELALIGLNGNALPANAYQLHEDGLTLRPPSDRFTLKTVVRIKPSKNTELMGLFVSNGNFFSQCEAEGFRRITFFPDRPDVMTTFRVTIRADKNALSGAAGQRQSDRAWRLVGRTTLRGLGRSVCQAKLSVRARRRQLRSARRTLHTGQRPGSSAADLRRARQPRQDTACNGEPEARDCLGRASLRPRARPRPIHDRRLATTSTWGRWRTRV